MAPSGPKLSKLSEKSDEALIIVTIDDAHSTQLSLGYSPNVQVTRYRSVPADRREAIVVGSVVDSGAVRTQEGWVFNEHYTLA